MLSLIFSCLLQSGTTLFNGDCPSPKLKNVLAIASEIHPHTVNLDTKASVNEYLQKNWLRTPGTERNAIVPPQTTPEQIEAFQQAFCDLEMIGAHKVERILTPAVVVILGGSYNNMIGRIAVAEAFLEPIKQKPRVILLTGDRTLEKTRTGTGTETDTSKPLDEGAPETCITEKDAGEDLAHKIPDLHMQVVNSPKQLGAPRATTADNATTLKKWLLANDIQGEIVLISTQPYGQYQLATFLKHCHDPVYHFSVLATPLQEPFNDTMVAKCMDTLARLVHTETTTP